MSLVNAGKSWIRQTLAWSNSWSSWQERAIMLVFLVGAILFGWLTTVVDFWFSAVLWAGYFIALTICTRQGYLKLFGPVLFYDMITTARRSRYVVMRLIYAAILLCILCFMYVIAAERNRGGRNDEMMIAGFMIGMFVLLIGLATEIILLMFIEMRVMRILLVFLLAITASLFVLGAFFFNLDNQNLHEAQSKAAAMAQDFFSMFMIVQLTLVVLLTPAYVAGAIAEEKDRKTMEFMLATDLSSREIVLSKLLSRLSNITMFLLTGLPILSVLQFLGGVDAHLMLAGFAATGLTMLGIASISILLSTLLKKPRDAIGVTYLIIITYIAIGTVAWAMAESRMAFMSETLWWTDNAPTLADASVWFNAGNPVSGIFDVGLAINGNSRRMGAGPGVPVTLAAALPGIMERYIWFHVPLSLFCVTLSILRLRAVALQHNDGTSPSLGSLIQRLRGSADKKPADDSAPTAPAPSWWDRFREPVGEAPMLWKELHIEGRARGSWIAIGAGSLLALLTIGSGFVVLAQFLWDLLFDMGNQGGDSLPQAMNIWFRVAGTGVASLMLLMVGVRASTSITNERERDTFDALVATPLSAENILASKLVGSMTSMRMGWLWFACMLAMALFTGGVHLLAVPILVTAWFIYATFFSMVGLWFSMVCKSSMRSTVYTVLTTLFLGGGHWLVTGMCCFSVFALMRFNHPGDFPEYLAKFEVGMTPPIVLGICAYSWVDLQHNFSQRELGEMIAFCLIGLFLWAMGCVVFWFGILVPKFKEIMRREELIYK